MKAPLKLNAIDQEHLQELYNSAGVARDELPTSEAFDSRGQTGLGRLALKRKDTALALRSFRSALATKPADAAAAHADLAEALLATGQTAEAKRETLEALEIAPSFERAQDLLLKITESQGGGGER